MGFVDKVVRERNMTAPYQIDIPIRRQLGQKQTQPSYNNRTAQKQSLQFFNYSGVPDNSAWCNDMVANLAGWIDELLRLLLGHCLQMQQLSLYLPLYHNAMANPITQPKPQHHTHPRHYRPYQDEEMKTTRKYNQL